VGLELKDRTGGPIDESLDPGLEELCKGLPGLKKLESCFRIAGEAGMFWRVSMVLSDNDGLLFLLTGWDSLSSSVWHGPSVISCSVESGRTGSCSRRAAFEGLLNRALLMAGRRVFGAETGSDAAEGSRWVGPRVLGSRVDVESSSQVSKRIRNDNVNTTY